MNSYDRCWAVMNGRVPDRIPVIPQTFMLAAEPLILKLVYFRGTKTKGDE